MSGFRWISLFLMLLLHLTAVTGQYSSFTVRDGDEVTLSCENVINDQDKCNSTTWIFSRPRSTAAVELIKFGQIGERAKAKSDRLSVTADCSLVIKKVTVEDVGRYTCRQFKSGQQQGQDAQVYLSVVTMTEHKDTDKVTLSCSVSTYNECRDTVKWLFNGRDLDVNTRDTQTSHYTCSDAVSFIPSHFIYISNYKLLKCEVTDLNSGKVQLYNFSPQLPREKPGPGEEGKTTTTKTTTETANGNRTESKKKTGVEATTTEPETTRSTATQEGEVRTDCSALSYIMLVMRVAELLLITVITVLLFRARGNQRPPDDNIVLNSVRSRTAKRSGPAASQEHNDKDDGAVNYENVGEPSASV